MQARGCGIRGSKLQEDLERHGRPLTVSAHGIGVWVKVNQVFGSPNGYPKINENFRDFFFKFESNI